MPEVDTSPVVDDRLPAITKMTGSALERWVEAGPEQALQRVDALVKTLELLRIHSIKATYPSDWIIHVSRDKDGTIISQRGYLQDIGAERAGKVWGIEVSQPIIEREDHPDGTFSYLMLADAWSKVTGERAENVEGARWSGDRFFARSVGPDEKIDPTDVRKAAFANLHGRAVRALAGLNGVPLEVLRAAGLDVSKVVVVDYEKGSKGGESAGASVGTMEPTIAWGNAKGQKLADLSDKDLTFYLGAYERDVADPAKAKFQRANQRMLDALRAEKERRARQAEQHEAAAADGTSAPVEEAAVLTTRGQKLGDLNTRLTDAAKASGVRLVLLLRTVTRDLLGAEITALSDLTEAQIDALNAVPESLLAKTAGSLAAAERGKGTKA
jgi:hypothetical protein